MTVGEIVREPLIVHRIGDKTSQIEKVRSLLETVGLTGDMIERIPPRILGRSAPAHRHRPRPDLGP